MDAPSLLIGFLLGATLVPAFSLYILSRFWGELKQRR